MFEIDHFYFQRNVETGCTLCHHKPWWCGFYSLGSLRLYLLSSALNVRLLTLDIPSNTWGGISEYSWKCIFRSKCTKM